MYESTPRSQDIFPLFLKKFLWGLSLACSYCYGSTVGYSFLKNFCRSYLCADFPLLFASIFSPIFTFCHHGVCEVFRSRRDSRTQFFSAPCYRRKKNLSEMSERFFKLMSCYSETTTDTLRCAPSHFTIPSLSANSV